MDNPEKYIPEEKLFEPIYKNSTVDWKKTKEHFWDSLEEKIDDSKKVRKINWLMFAAGFAILIVIGTFGYLNKTKINTNFGEHRTVLLPDGSSVVLNSKSSLKYNHLYWRFLRKVELEGEAYFQVEKGKTFTVSSQNGTTKVLGTSFNVLSNGSKYEVTCFTGRVFVESNGFSEVLTEAQQISIIEKQMKFTEHVNVKNALLWKDYKFAFNGVLLSDVFKEIERLYGVTIVYSPNTEKRYSGVFKQKNIEDDLAIICKPFGLNIEKIGSTTYRIIEIN